MSDLDIAGKVEEVQTARRDITIDAHAEAATSFRLIQPIWLLEPGKAELRIRKGTI